jgi:hypothetical protein
MCVSACVVLLQTQFLLVKFRSDEVGRLFEGTCVSATIISSCCVASTANTTAMHPRYKRRGEARIENKVSDADFNDESDNEGACMLLHTYKT